MTTTPRIPLAIDAAFLREEVVDGDPGSHTDDTTRTWFANATDDDLNELLNRQLHNDAFNQALTQFVLDTIDDLGPTDAHTCTECGATMPTYFAGPSHQHTTACSLHTNNIA